MSAPVGEGMDRAGLLGVSWRHATSATIARYTLPREHRVAAMRALAEVLEVRELVYLATCNRVEVLFAGGADLPIAVRRRRFHAHLRHGTPSAEPAERAVRAWEGEGLVEHLFLLAAGLDSARVGESEVTGQLRDAMADAESAGLLAHTLRPLLEDAFRIARRVRPITEGHVGGVSLADVAVRVVRAQLARQQGAVALIGVSPMTQRAGVALHGDGVRLVVVNRTPAHAAPLASMLAAEVHDLEAFRASPSPVVAVVCATGAREPLFDDATLARMAAQGTTLVVDFGVPPNVRAEDAAEAGLTHLGMDAMNSLAHEARDADLSELGEARALIDDALEARRRRRWEAVVDPAIVELRRRLAARADAEVTRALQQELAGLGPAEQAAVRRLSGALTRQLAHVPSRGLRDLAGNAGPEAAAAFLGTAAPDLAADVRARSRGLRRFEEFA